MRFLDVSSSFGNFVNAVDTVADFSAIKRGRIRIMQKKDMKTQK